MTILTNPAKLLLIVFFAALSASCGQGADQGSSDQQQTVRDNNTGPVVSSRYAGTPLVVGDRFEMEISMDNFPVSEGGGVSLKFNPAVLKIEKVDQEFHWDLAYQPGTIDNAGGEVSDIMISSFNGNSGSVTFATIHAKAVGSGTSSIDLIESVKNPFAASGKQVPVVLKSSFIQVN